MDDQIFVTRPFMPPFEEYCEELRKIWDSRRLTNLGPEHRQLEIELENYFNVQNVLLYTNGHLALEAAISAFGFPKGSEVITTPFTFASTTHAIVRCGLTPVFCDVDPADLTLDVSRIEELITEKTAAILPVHVYGRICDVDRIQEIADRRGLKVIYDAAHAFGVRYKGRSAASFGHVSMISFHATKVFHTIEGGAAAVNDAALIQALFDSRNYGIRDEEHVVYPGGNAKMNEFQAAMGLVNLRHMDEILKGRRRVIERYQEALSGIPGIRILPKQKDVDENYAYFPVIFDGYKYSRDEIYDRLSKEGIYARKYFYPLTSDYECYRNEPFAGGEKTPVAAFASSHVLTLPVYTDLEEKDVDRVIRGILA